MGDSAGMTTTTELLDSLKDAGNAAVWTQFDARYRPVLIGFARHLGLHNEDAADVAQQALLEFIRDFRAGRYERGRGRLSSWLISIARNRAVDLQRSMGRRRAVGGESVIDRLPAQEETSHAALQDPGTLSAIWESERRQAILAAALEHLRTHTKTNEKTLQAFELVAVRGVPPEAVARECGMSVDEVYVAKNRVTKQLRAVVEEMTRAYDED
jgi:RNA polymerase sigma factor (sigma-70 family)